MTFTMTAPDFHPLTLADTLRASGAADFHCRLTQDIKPLDQMPHEHT
jgi:hypothetical protein